MKRAAVLATCLTLPLASLTACSDAGNRASTGPSAKLDCDPSRNSEGARGVTKTSVKVRGLLLKTSPAGVSFAGNDIGAKARFDRANREGGVHCRLIDYGGAEDDGNDPGRNLAGARKLTTQDKVFAVVPAYSTTFSGAAYLVQNKVPFIGHAVSPPFCGNAWGMGMGGCYTAPPNGMTQTAWERMLAKVIGGADGKTAAVIAHDSVGGKAGVAPIRQAATAAGFRVVYAEAPLPATSVPSDWTPWVRRLMTANGGKPVDVVFSATQTPNNAGLYGALKAAGFTGAFTNATDYQAKLLKNPELVRALDGAYVNVPFVPFESGSAAARQLRDDVAKSSPGAELDTSVGQGYWSADLFLRILQQTGPELTPETFSAAADRLTGNSPGVGALNGKAMRLAPTGCSALVQIKDGAYRVASELTCHPNVPVTPAGN